MAIEATAASVDAVSNILVEEGCGGTVIGPAPAASGQGANRVTGYLPVDDRLEGRLDNIRDRVKALPSMGLELVSDEITITWIQDEEWATAWKKHFKPVRVGRIIVRPSWEECETEAEDIVVDIDPGMAFGTGYHPTTQLCLRVLQDYVKGGEVVLDMGTGSAVLAIAAAKLGAASVVGYDADTVAVEVGEKNVAHAGLSDVVKIARADTPLAFEGQADIIVANIIAKVLIEMAEALAAKTKPGGLCIASGIVIERKDDVERAFEDAGLRIAERRVDGDWVALVCKKAS